MGSGPSQLGKNATPGPACLTLTSPAHKGSDPSQIAENNVLLLEEMGKVYRLSAKQIDALGRLPLVTPSLAAASKLINSMQNVQGENTNCKVLKKIVRSAVMVLKDYLKWADSMSSSELAMADEDLRELHQVMTDADDLFNAYASVKFTSSAELQQRFEDVKSLLNANLDSLLRMKQTLQFSTRAALPAAEHQGAAAQTQRLGTNPQTLQGQVDVGALAQVMISYRRQETGVAAGGGDSSAPALAHLLRQHGYTVFVDTEGLRGGDRYNSIIAKAILDCKAFVAVCSTSYGAEGSYTEKEFCLAEGLGLPIFPVWHSGPWLPTALSLKLSLSRLNYIPQYGALTLLPPSEMMKTTASELISALTAKGVGVDLTVGASGVQIRPEAKAAEPESSNPASHVPKPQSSAAAQIMISYRVPETGPMSKGGDGFSAKLKSRLVAEGYTVFLDIDNFEHAMDAATIVQANIRNCSAFIAVCSDTYGGKESPWTTREFMYAESLNKVIIPIYHSGAWPPRGLAMFLAQVNYLPAAGCITKAPGVEIEQVVTEAMQALKHYNITPSAILSSNV